MEKYTDWYVDYIIHELKTARELAKIGYSHSLSDCEKDVMFAAIMQRLEVLQRNVEKHYTEKYEKYDEKLCTKCAKNETGKATTPADENEVA